MKTFKLICNEIGYTKFLFNAETLEDAKSKAYKYAVNNDLIDAVSCEEFKEGDDKGYGFKNELI